METENVMFNEKFHIEADSPKNAFLILTPHFMEDIMKVDSLTSGNTFIGFIGQKIYIAIHSNQYLLEIDKKHKNTEQIRTRQKKELKYITDIIDVFLRNKKLFGG
jgi:hypothetical protein